MLRRWARRHAVRLFTACTDKDRGRTVEELERELADAHRREAATAEVLRIISRSPTDVQPVFETIAESATLLCDGLYSVVFRFDGEMITVAADSCGSPQTSAFIRSAYPAPPGKGTLASRALLERRVITITDAQDSFANPDGAERARVIGYRAGLSVPMLRGDRAIGVINVVRREAIPFTHVQVELLKSFADQAVIAIENARLFEAEQASKRGLQESLEYQTAISEVLGAISRSPHDLQPVLDIARRRRRAGRARPSPSWAPICAISSRVSIPPPPSMPATPPCWCSAGPQRCAAPSWSASTGTSLARAPALCRSARAAWW